MRGGFTREYFRKARLWELHCNICRAIFPIWRELEKHIRREHSRNRRQA